MEMVSQQLTGPVTALEYSLWSEDQLKYLALHDYVTGLPNRYLFQDRLVHCLAYSKRYQTNPAVIFICVDGFLPVDDTIFTRQIDTMMKEMARRLLHFKRESDTLARLDTHEFGLILEHVADQTAIVSVARRISSSISEPFRLNGHQTKVNASISFCADLDDCADTEVYRNIDIANYYSKRKLIALTEGHDHDLVG
jgi:diguanylate cyclase (GGDEF)-like protein